MSSVRFDFSSPSIFNCHRLAFVRVEYAGSTWYSLRVYGDGEDANHGKEIATIHCYKLPPITYDHGNAYVTHGNENPLTLEPVPCQTSNS